MLDNTQNDITQAVGVVMDIGRPDLMHRLMDMLNEVDDVKLEAQKTMRVLLNE